MLTHLQKYSCVYLAQKHTPLSLSMRTLIEFCRVKLKQSKPLSYKTLLRVMPAGPGTKFYFAYVTVKQFWKQKIRFQGFASAHADFFVLKSAFASANLRMIFVYKLWKWFRTCLQGTSTVTVTIQKPDNRLPDSSEYRANCKSGFWMVLTIRKPD